LTLDLTIDLDTILFIFQDACLGPLSSWKLIFEYVLNAVRSLNGRVPTFLMPWLCWPFHDFFRTLGLLDEDLLSFFKELRGIPEVLERTVVVVMGDHSFYQPPYGETHEGLLERRLPLLLLRLPETLKAHQEALEENAAQVVSHYDVYKTLLEISRLPGGALPREGEGLGLSLLSPLPKGRTCADAGVPPTFCACNLPPPPLKAPANSKVPPRVRIPHKKPYVDRSMWARRGQGQGAYPKPNALP
jgi:hypothetical protein